MTFKITVKDDKGNGIERLWVFAGDEMNGAGIPRSTDGDGYADVFMSKSNVGDRVTLCIMDPEYRFKGKVFGDSLVIGTEDQAIEVTLVPFV